MGSALGQTDWAQLGRYKDANAALPAHEKGRVVFYGDSITDAWAKQPAVFFPGKPFVGRGISGQTTPQMLVRFRQDVIDLHPEAVVILAGTNDIAGNTGPETPEMVEGYLTSMAELARVNHIKVVLCSIMPVLDYPWRKGMEPSPKIKAINAWMKAYAAREGFAYVDYYTAMDDGTGAAKAGLTKDGVHPTAEGYRLMEPLALAGIEGK
jgi:lysophospholipase L1-like esterase